MMQNVFIIIIFLKEILGPRSSAYEHRLFIPTSYTFYIGYSNFK